MDLKHKINNKGTVDGKGKSRKKAVDEEPKQSVGDSFDDQSSLNGVGDKSSMAEEHDVQKTAAVKLRTKLHWGLDTRERWERKSNM